MAVKINIADVQGLIALAILNNKTGLINVMNSSGYRVAPNVSDNDLYDAVATIGDNEGRKKLASILSRVPWDKSKISQAEARNLAIKFKGINPNAKFGDWLDELGQGIGDFLSGTTVINQNPNSATQTSESALSPMWIIITAILGIIGIVYVNKKEIKGATGISLAIGIIVLAVAGYGIFGKTVTLTSSGGGGTQNIHNGALGWIKGILNGLNLSVVGK